MTRVGEDVSERLDIVPAEFFVHVVDGQGKTLDRVPFSLPGARRSTWVRGVGPLSDPNRQHLALTPA